MKSRTAFSLFAALCACSRAPVGFPAAPVRHYALSPDQTHLVIVVGASGRSVEVETGAETALQELDEQWPLGGFSADGSIFLTRTAAGHLVVMPASAGTPVDLGEALDLGKLSPDGTLVAVLRNRSQCSQFSCADLVVVPARGGTAAVVARGFRLVGNPTGPAGLNAWDQYQFAGNTRILFTNPLGELWSVQVDGTDLVRIAESHDSFAGLPLPPAWAVSPDGSTVVYSHASGVSIQPAGGGAATLLATDPDARVPCNLAGNPVCAFWPDGAHVILQRVTFGAFHLTSVPLAGGTPTTLSDTSVYAFGFLSDGRFLFTDRKGYVLAPVSGQAQAVPANPGEFACASASCVSPDGKWVAFQSEDLTSTSCSACAKVRVVSTTSDVSWTVADANGPLLLSGFVEPRPNATPISFAPDSSSFVAIKPYEKSDVGYPIGDLQMFSVSGGPGRIIADRVAYAMWVGPRHVVYERFLRPLEPKVHLDRVR